MAFSGKVRDRVHSYFSPDGFDPLAFRSTAQMALMAMVLTEVTVYILLQQSARLGELPTYVPDVLIIIISTLEFFLGPVIGWLGSNRRRTTMVMWALIALVCTLPVFGTPSPVAEADTALCTSRYLFLPSGMTPRTATRLSILVLAGLSSALGRQAIMAHALAYLDEDKPSANTHMDLGIFLIARIVPLHVGKTLLGAMTEKMPWLQPIFIVIKLIIVLVKLHKYPMVPAAVDKRLGSERSLFQSIGRVLRSRMAMVQILAMSLLAAAAWGFGSQEEEFAKVKFHTVAAEDNLWEMVAPVRIAFIIAAVIVSITGNLYPEIGQMGVITRNNVDMTPKILKQINYCPAKDQHYFRLSGFLYTAPVMPVYEKMRALGNVVRVTILCMIIMVMMTAYISCNKTPLAGMAETTYNQPACGLQCGCDRPWTSFSPVCDPGNMTTYFSPCHAGCSTVETAGEVGFYSNCSCAAGGRAIVGACDDGSCSTAYALHTAFSTCITLASILGLTWQGTVMLESVDRRDKSVAVGLASGTVSLFTFVGGHALYMWISDFTCVSLQGSRCLWHNSLFVPLVGYTSTGLAGASLLITIGTVIFIYCQKKEEKKEFEEVDLS